MTNHRLSAAALAAGVLLALGASTAWAAELRTNDTPIQGQYIVVLKEQAARLSAEPAAGKARVPEIARAMSAGHGAKLVRSFEHALRGFVVNADDAALAKLLADPRVEYVEEDGIVSINATQTNAPWGLDRIDQHYLPLNGTYIYDTTASNVHAYVIDTGVLLTHSQFTGRIGNGFDAVTSGGNANDCNGHGTHVAGIIGGTTWGVAKGVKIHPVRVVGCNGAGTTSGVIAGVDWVRVNRIQPAVANMSLGGGASSALNTAVNNLINSGVSVVAAAGSSTGSACNSSPAGVPNAITVGATQSNDTRAPYSNYGPCLDLFAPGSLITSAWYTSTTASTTISGTSMAAPHVTGAAALYLANTADATPAMVSNAIVSNATPNVVINPGTGSPNLLLYSRFPIPSGTAPVIGAVRCLFDGVNSDCSVNYTSATPATVSWNRGSASGNWTYGVCGTGGTSPYSVTVIATVSNAYGSASRSVTASCNPGGEQY